MTTRPFDLVLLGATGFMGRLVAEQILATAPADLTWGIAGRDPRKLMDVKMALVGADRRAASVGLLTADAESPASLVQLAKQTRVLASTVGPYALWGEPIVAACVQQRTHYLDIAAEPAFVRNVAHLFDREAHRRGVTLVCCCGYDAVPADVGAHHVVRQLDEGPRLVLAYLRARTHPSGGSWASRLASAAGSGRRPPGALPRRSSQPPGVHRAPPEASGGYALPLRTADRTVVRCTARSLASVYGGDFVYGHYLRVASKRQIAKEIAARGAMTVASRMPFGRRALERPLPTGEGPSEADRASAYFDLTLVGSTPTQRVITRISGADPGTTVTSEIFAACAQLLAARPPTPRRTGLLTPMMAFGGELPALLTELGMPITTLSLT